MDPVSLVVGAMIALGGVLVGRLLPNRRSSVPPAQASLTQGPRTLSRSAVADTTWFSTTKRTRRARRRW